MYLPGLHECSLQRPVALRVHRAAPAFCGAMPGPLHGKTCEHMLRVIGGINKGSQVRQNWIMQYLIFQRHASQSQQKHGDIKVSK
ncbi:hypothetical protein DPMN_065897 [Dreissena polymorpha]|uniref:Uncharacterized protein n=1 Tax=Dreissena polymorpha TaxID=45954 RepID=A0A9D3YWT2_DREPO|nr:hypothetical protein DPMN_065897 [Dreissena polymorpha]